MEKILEISLLWLMGSLVVGIIVGHIFWKMNNND